MRRGLVLLAAAAAVMGAGAVVFAAVQHVSVATAGYWAVTTATTTGYGDVAPHGPGRAVAAAVMLLAVPLLGAAFAELTAHRHRAHLREELTALEERVKAHLAHVSGHADTTEPGDEEEH